MEVPSQLVSRCLDRRNLRAGEAAGQQADDAMTDFHQLIEPDLLLQNQYFFTHALDTFVSWTARVISCAATQL